MEQAASFGGGGREWSATGQACQPREVFVAVKEVVCGHHDVGVLDVLDTRLVEVGDGLDHHHLEGVVGELLDLFGPLAHQLRRDQDEGGLYHVPTTDQVRSLTQ